MICSVCRKYHKSAVDRSPWVSEQSEDTDTMNKPYPSRCEMNPKGHAREGRVMTSRKAGCKARKCFVKNVSLTKT